LAEFGGGVLLETPTLTQPLLVVGVVSIVVSSFFGAVMHNKIPIYSTVRLRPVFVLDCGSLSNKKSDVSTSICPISNFRRIRI